MFKTSTIFAIIHFLFIGLFTPNLLAEEKTFRQPAEISEQEWNDIKDKKYEYTACLKQEMVKQVEHGNDARQVADRVLEICSIHLIAMQTDMDANNIEPGFTERYIYNTKNKAGRQMLGGIMMLMAQKQAVQESPETESAEAEGTE